MKKQLIFLLTAFLFLTGCGSGSTDDGSTLSQQEQQDAVQLADCFTVPDGWVKAEAYSTEEKLFYVQEGHEDDAQPDNISINTGTNRYSAGEHEDFRDAILRQLLMQIQGVDAELTGDGTYTEQGYVVYIFTITESSAVTKQYYIVDDYRYCLIHLTDYTGSDSVYDAAQAMADSFVWDGIPTEE